VLDDLNVRSAGVLVAVSGGADSMALFRGLHALRAEFNLTLAAAHLDHGLRGADSAADAEWLAQQCRLRDVPIAVEREDVAARAAEARGGIEETARRVRYAFLLRAAREHHCEFVAVAHTADDQAETILHHIVRGTGLAGLRGMPVSRTLGEGVRLIRPLLRVTRADVEHYLRGIGQPFRDDLTNVDPRFTRNRMRHELLPLLRNEFNPQIGEVLRTLGTQAEEAQAVVERAAAALLDKALADASPELARLDCRALEGEPRHLVREVLRLFWRRQGWPDGGMTFEHWDAAASLATGAAREALTLPGGIRCFLRGHLLVVEAPPSQPDGGDIGADTAR
jgi:tRNA(Ile)-lysidine synthase